MLPKRVIETNMLQQHSHSTTLTFDMVVCPLVHVPLKYIPHCRRKGAPRSDVGVPHVGEEVLHLGVLSHDTSCTSGIKNSVEVHLNQS